MRKTHLSEQVTMLPFGIMTASNSSVGNRATVNFTGTGHCLKKISLNCLGAAANNLKDSHFKSYLLSDQLIVTLNLANLGHLNGAPNLKNQRKPYM